MYLFLLLYSKTASVLRVTIAVVKHHGQKQVGEERGLFSLDFHITVHLGRKSEQELTQGRSLEAGTAQPALSLLLLLFLWRQGLSI